MGKKILKIVAAAEQIETLKQTNTLIFMCGFGYLFLFLFAFAVHIKAIAIIFAVITFYKYFKQRKEITRIKDKYEL